MPEPTSDELTAIAPRHRMPAEWERHEATWLAWPSEKPAWDARMHAVPWTFGEIARALAGHERVEVLCHDERTRAAAREVLEALAVPAGGYGLHLAANDRVWLRDTGPAGVVDAAGRLAWLRWRHWTIAAAPERFPHDRLLGETFASLTGAPLVEATSPAGPAGARVVLEGGAIDVDGAGSLVAVERSVVGERGAAGDAAMDREGFALMARERLAAGRVVWLGETCAGDATRGHVDLVARWVAPGTLALAVEDDPDDENHRRSADSLRRLALDAPDVRVVRLPFPAPRVLWGERLPASYANFYVANGVVLVPTYNDANDRRALEILAGCFPDRRVVGVGALDLVWGHGALHCATLQQPASRGRA